MKRIKIKECHVCGELLLYVRFKDKIYSIGSKPPLEKYTVYVNKHRIEPHTKCDNCGAALNSSNLVWFIEHLANEE